MQTIYKAQHHTRFSFVGSDFCNAKIPSDAKNVLLFLIDKPIDWKLIVKNIANTLDLSIYAVRKALRWLIDHGYASYQRLSDGRTIWQIFEQPKQAATPVMTPRVEIPNVETQHDIHITQTPLITQKTTTPSLPVQVNNTPPAPTNAVDVVVERELIDQQATTERQPTATQKSEKTDNHITDVPGIEPQHQAVAKRALSRLTEEQASEVLVAFTLAASKSNISNRVGYLIRLVQSTTDGTFSPVGATGGAPAPTLDERLAKERQRQQEAAQRGAMTSEQHARWLAENFGARPVDAGKSVRRRVGLRAALGWG